MRSLTTTILSTTAFALTIGCAEDAPAEADAEALSDAPAILDAGSSCGHPGGATAQDACDMTPDMGQDGFDIEPQIVEPGGKIGAACPAISDAESKTFAGMGELAAACDQWMDVEPYAYMMSQEVSLSGGARAPIVVVTHVVDGEISGAMVDGQRAAAGATMQTLFSRAADAMRDKAWITEVSYDAESGAITEVALKRAGTKNAWHVVSVDVNGAWDEGVGRPEAL